MDNLIQRNIARKCLLIFILYYAILFLQFQTPIPISFQFQNEAGWIGFYGTLAGIGAGLLLARCADLFGGKMKVLLLVLFFGASGCFLWFSLLCLRMIDYVEGKTLHLPFSL